MQLLKFEMMNDMHNSIKLFTQRVIRWILIGTVLNIMLSEISAQELSPRAYWPAPKGTKVAVAGYSYSFGDVLTDPSLPIAGLDSRIHVGLIAYLQTLSLCGRTANILVELPYVCGTTKGTLESEPKRRDISGIADIGITLSANLIGAPSMNSEDFKELRQNPHPILGASLKILVPTGAYETDKMINVGANRWAFKTELGYMIPLENKWLLEIEAGIWFFADNNEFLGVTREQKPVIASEIHLVRRFKPGFWAALDLNFFTGGRSAIGGKLSEDLQRNSLIGCTIVYPFAVRYALKAGYSRGMVTKSGNDFESFILSYQVLLE